MFSIEKTRRYQEVAGAMRAKKMTTTTSIVGNFPIGGCENETELMNRVLNTPQASEIKFGIAHDDSYRPRCRIGRDERGVTVVSITQDGEAKLWGREDFGRHRVHDPHTLGPVYAYDRPCPICDREYEITKENVEYCRDKYSVSMGL